MTNLVTRYDAARLGLLRTSRRDVLRFSVGAGLGAVLLPLLAACGSSKSSTPTATAGSGAAGATDEGNAHGYQDHLVTGVGQSRVGHRRGDQHWLDGA